MFVIHCATCQLRHLVGTRSITSFRNTDDGPELVLTCPKGHEAHWPNPPAAEIAEVADLSTPTRSFESATHMTRLTA